MSILIIGNINIKVDIILVRCIRMIALMVKDLRYVRAKSTAVCLYNQQHVSALAFGNEGAISAEGGVFAGGGVAAEEGLRFIGKEAFGAVYRRLLHSCAADSAHAAAAAHAGRRLQRLVDGTEAMAYIHRGHQLVCVKLKRRRKLEQTLSCYSY